MLGRKLYRLPLESASRRLDARYRDAALSVIGFVAYVCATLALAMSPAAGIAAEAATANGAMVATVHPLATDAGLRAMRAGGNAVDAAVAAALTLGVVDGHNSGIGGGCFIVIRRADGKLFAIDGRETAPAAARRDMYVAGGRVHPQWSKNGALACAVPGALAGLDLALKKHGELPLADLLRPAATIAEEGFPIDRIYAGKLKATADVLAQYPESRRILLREDGAPLAKGSVLKQPDLAATYRAIAEGGIDWFYRGPFATRLDVWMKANRGLLTAEDLAAYRPVERTPLVSTYRDYTVVGFPPPSSGGVHVAEILNILEHHNLLVLDKRDPALRMHVMIEAMKLAFADRAYWLGDPAFAKVPRGLIDKQYAAQLAKRIDLNKVLNVARHGEPPQAEQDVFGKHTTHIAATDADGNWVAITSTVNTSFGSKVIVPDTGVLLNNQMDDFSMQPGVPNAFGLVGAEANAIAPGKRPLSSMSPTILLRDDRPVLTVGAAGGPRIISQVVQTITNHVDLQMPLAEAVAAKRFHHQWRPDQVLLETGFDPRLAAKLRELGHRTETRSYLGVTQAIGRTAGGPFVGVHDPRVPGKAAGF